MAETQIPLNKYLCGAHKEDKRPIGLSPEAVAKFKKLKKDLADAALMAHSDSDPNGSVQIPRTLLWVLHKNNFRISVGSHSLSSHVNPHLREGGIVPIIESLPRRMRQLNSFAITLRVVNLLYALIINH